METMSNLYLKDSYIIEGFDYLISIYIREYDISKANINILFSKGIIDNNQFNNLFNMERLQRQIAIGYLIKDNPDINAALKNGFTEYRKKFFEANGLEDNDIVSIKKDAIYIMNKIPAITKFDTVEFIIKNVYTSFYKIHNLEFYYYLDSINGIERLDIKGIKDEMLSAHESYMLEFLKVVFNEVQTNSIESAIDITSTFYKQYLELSLDIGYYRELSPQGLFRLKGSRFSTFGARYLSEDSKQDLDIGNNRMITETLHSYLSNIYLSRMSQKHINKRR